VFARGEYRLGFTSLTRPSEKMIYVTTGEVRGVEVRGGEGK